LGKFYSWGLKQFPLGKDRVPGLGPAARKSYLGQIRPRAPAKIIEDVVVIFAFELVNNEELQIDATTIAGTRDVHWVTCEP